MNIARLIKPLLSASLTAITTTVLLPQAYAGELLYSLKSDRSEAEPLATMTFSNTAQLYIFLDEPNIAAVDKILFYLDDPTFNGRHYRRENYAPYDLRGGAPFSTAGIAAGNHNIVTITYFKDGSSEINEASFVVDPEQENIDRDGDGILNADDLFPDDPNEAYDLDLDGIGDNSDKDLDGDGTNNNEDSFPRDPTRSAAQAIIAFSHLPDRTLGNKLNNADFSPEDELYIFIDVTGQNNISQVLFYLDDPNFEQRYLRREGYYPFDFRGGSPYSLAQLTPGQHTVSSQTTYNTGETEISHAHFWINSPLIDTDGDSIEDNLDQCPNTLPLSITDAIGCSYEQLDDDGDGILNGADQCPNTPISTQPNTEGCADSQIDFDGDGIPSGEDACPETPSNETTDLAGCSIQQLDDDGDGVINRNDTCANTPVASMANLEGCSSEQIDFDGDGIPFGEDFCPGTVEGRITNSNGCAEEQLDEDQDGIQDSLDLCSGTPTNRDVTHFGCAIGEDNDGDRIPNDFDLCPNSMGLVELKGCKPQFGDFDADDIPDILDDCPHSIHPNSAKPLGAEFYADEDFVVNESGCSTYDEQASGDRIENGSSLCYSSFPDPELYWQNSDGMGMWTQYGCTALQLKDDDKDGIINGLDVCPEEFGIKLLNGCLDENFPGDFFDYDSDRVPNDQDHCPFTPQIDSDLNRLIGPNGCFTTVDGKPHFQYEDIDQDDIPGMDDQCPATPLGHVIDANGCTATQQYNQRDDDQDGVVNQWDQCDNTFLHSSSDKELLTALGCNAVDEDYHMTLFDTEFSNGPFIDGIPRHMDACPEEAGLLIHNGCPTKFTTRRTDSNTRSLDGIWEDKDNDYVPDFDDKCAYTRRPMDGNYGVETEEHGCFISDLKDDDSDGIINGKDRCPMSKNSDYLDSEGCNDWDRLDSDGDKVINGQDLCPQAFGFWQSNGCADSHWDSDMDGVPNELDRCPLSAGNASGPFANIDHQELDENGKRNPNLGCALEKEMRDDDGDNVPNIDDRCPNTPFGDQVWPVNGSNDAEWGCSFAQSDHPGELCFEGPDMNIIECSAPWGDDDGDNVPNERDQCANTPHAVPMDSWAPERKGCKIGSRFKVSSPIHLRHITEPSPEFPPEQQEHEIDLSALLPIPESSSLFPHQERQAEIGEFSDQEKVDIFNDFNRLIIHIRPEERLRTFRIPVRIHFMDSDISSNWFEIVISPQGSASTAGFDNVIINDPAVLAQTGITLHSAFMRLAAVAPQPFAPAPAVQLFRQLWDSQRSNSVFGLPFFCTGEINGFPIVCDRPETDIAFFDEFSTQIEMDRYRLTAIVNRFDLRKENWQDCGEHRLVFALQDNMETRKFLNLEARVPNPTPGDIHGCAPSIEFWQDVAHLSAQDKVHRIVEFIMGSELDPYAILSPEHFFEESGQIRTNQFVGGEWLLKEHKLVDTCAGSGCAIYAETVSVKENPFGELFNPNLPFSGSPFAFAAMEFQNTFWQAIDNLTSESFGELKLTTAEQFNHGQSHAGGPEMQENDYRMHFGGQFNSPFGNEMMFALEGRRNADGSPLEVEQVLARASGLTCGGCHNPEQLGLTQPGSIGRLRLPDGSIIDSWPRSHDFVHINELGELSPGMLEVYLPVRQAGFEELMMEY